MGNRNPVDADVSPLSPAGGGEGDGGGRLVDVRAVLLAVAAALQGDLRMTGGGGGNGGYEIMIFSYKINSHTQQTP